MKHFVYVGSVIEHFGEVRKIGRTTNLYNRSGSLNTSYPRHGIRFEILIPCASSEELDKIEKYLHSYFDEFSTRHADNFSGGGIEWFSKQFSKEELRKALDEEGYDNEVIDDPEEIRKFQEMHEAKVREYNERQLREINELCEMRRTKKAALLKKLKTFSDRTYQSDLITYCTRALLELNKIYLKLATAGGKSYCVFNTIKELMTRVELNNIVIFTPRVKISKQNVDDKYIRIIDPEKQYSVYNYSDMESEFVPNENGKNIIVACSKSKTEIVKLIKDNHLTDCFVWFDEAHHTIEKWAKDGKVNSDEDIKYLLTDTATLKYRIFTSASPDECEVPRYEDIFGELYEPIKIFELIDQRWLCEIKPYMYHTEERGNVNYLKYILERFITNDCKYGFSFHNNCHNAFSLFKIHYEEYVAGNTKVRPYILFNKAFIKADNPNKQFNEEFNDPKYKDFKHIEKFEDDAHISLGYVVQKYNIGYDFEHIDFIVFSDNKMSYPDIVQSVGRGMRPDKKGVGGCNLEKYLTLMLPVYIDTDRESPYDTLMDVLKYIECDLDIPLKDIPYNSGGYTAGRTDSNISNRSDYDGNEIMKSIEIDLIEDYKKVWRLKGFTEHLRRLRITDKEKYSHYISERPKLDLPANINAIRAKFPDFTWASTYYDGENPYYEDRYECIEAIKVVVKMNDDIREQIELNEEDKENILNANDPKIPPRVLHYFYGGEEEDYLI